jgi:translation elongation factor P/translation initiation factor 5A
MSYKRDEMFVFMKKTQFEVMQCNLDALEFRNQEMKMESKRIKVENEVLKK